MYAGVTTELPGINLSTYVSTDSFNLESLLTDVRDLLVFNDSLMFVMDRVPLFTLSHTLNVHSVTSSLFYLEPMYQVTDALGFLRITGTQEHCLKFVYEYVVSLRSVFIGE